MKVEVLQAFVVVAEQCSFSKAADRLYLSPPTVSRYIAEMEKTVGDTLFIRNAHNCELTLLGKQIYVHAKRMLNEWENIEALIREKNERCDEALRIGYTYQEMLKFITLAFSATNWSNPNLEVSVRFGDGSDITRLVREGLIDCAIMHLPSVSNSQGLNIRLICKCGMCFHVPLGHRFAKMIEIKMEQLIHETDVRITAEKGFYRMADEAFSLLNLPQMKHIYVERAADCMPIGRYKNCICLSPEIYSSWPEYHKVTISDWTTDFSLVFVTKNGFVSDTTEKLYRSLCEICKDKV